jgi:hypothetical protein
MRLTVCMAFLSLVMNAEQAQSAKGTFSVKLVPQPPLEGQGPEDVPGRMSIDKQFQGDLTGISKGQMLAAMTAVKGSAGYVAIEKVTGTLAGRSGTFLLQHNATATSKEQNLNIIVIPDSGTGELAGITGKMMIKIEGSKHYYEFTYSLPPAPK